MTTTAILQARMGSTRLPGKMTLPIIDGKGALELMVERVSQSKTLDRVIVATTVLPEDDTLAEVCKHIGVPTFRGDPADVLDRYYQCARTHARDDILVRLTGDCPLHDPSVIDRVVTYFLSARYDYAANTHPPTFPDGLDTEVFTYAALERAWSKATLLSEREHVTYYIYTHPNEFQIGNFASPVDLSAHRWTLDEPADLLFIRRMYTELQSLGHTFGLNDVLELLRRRPDLLELNSDLERDAGLKSSLELDRQMGNRQ
jgi:spore coat polysaccharide biosynthesis protein SpsF (cytidylyltransferase family)